MKEKLFFKEEYFEEDYSQDDYIEELIKSIEKIYSITEKNIIVSKHQNPFENESDNSFEE